MARVKLDFGAEVDFLTPAEFDSALKDRLATWETERLRGIKWMRLPEVLSGKAASSAISLGETSGQIVGPRQGYVWSIRRLVVNGLTSGATPDVVNLYRSGTTGQPLWQFNGNSFGATFGRLELTLNGGETLALASVGTFNSTSQVTLSGELLEAPAELVGKLA